MNRARFSLLGLFTTFLIIQMLALSIVSQKMWPEEYQTLMLKILSVYSVPLTTILGAIFAQTNTRFKDPSAELAWTAILLALIWNLLLGWRLISFSAAAKDSVQNLQKYYEGVSAASSFLITGMLAFFFTKGSKADGHALSRAASGKHENEGHS